MSDDYLVHEDQYVYQGCTFINLRLEADAPDSYLMSLRKYDDGTNGDPWTEISGHITLYDCHIEWLTEQLRSFLDRAKSHFQEDEVMSDKPITQSEIRESPFEKCLGCGKYFNNSVERAEHECLMQDKPIAQAEIRDTVPTTWTCVTCKTVMPMGVYHKCPFPVEPPQGTKLDKNKPRWSLLPAGTISQIIAVLEYGAAKYSVDNWQHVTDHKRRYYDAAMRHINAWFDEKNDPESGLPHLAHAAACILFLMWFDAEEK